MRHGRFYSECQTLSNNSTQRKSRRLGCWEFLIGVLIGLLLAGIIIDGLDRTIRSETPRLGAIHE